MLRCNNLLLRIITPNHIKNIQNVTNPSNLSTILYEDHILHEKVKKIKKKSRIYKIIQSRIQIQDKIATDVIVIL